MGGPSVVLLFDLSCCALSCDSVTWECHRHPWGRAELGTARLSEPACIRVENARDKVEVEPPLEVLPHDQDFATIRYRPFR